MLPIVFIINSRAAYFSFYFTNEDIAAVTGFLSLKYL
jgi:hypothetical protein